MILSYHPLVEADQNLLCAGRLPDTTDQALIRSADAVILPQGCKQELYEMAADNCRFVFPDYRARFRYPGKIGQIRLFRQCRVPHPQTRIYPAVPTDLKTADFRFPLVFKYDWGGEGDTVFLLQNASELRARLAEAARFEATGQSGFLLQEYIPCDQRVLRVVVIGRHLQSYWRIQTAPDQFTVNLPSGAIIDPDYRLDLQQKASDAARRFCSGTRINLAGFDFLFNATEADPDPLFLEINYFFGRQGLGGSEAFYAILLREIQVWIASL